MSTFQSHDLTDAKLLDAKFDRNTEWPEDFDPIAAGAILVEEEDPDSP